MLAQAQEPFWQLPDPQSVLAPQGEPGPHDGAHAGLAQAPFVQTCDAQFVGWSHGLPIEQPLPHAAHDPPAHRPDAHSSSPMHEAPCAQG
jgi:hypothetical protein